MNRKIIVFLALFVLSRIFFINPLPVFFDSPEYLSRLSNPNYLQAIASGHIPYHAGYIAFSWPTFNIAQFLGVNPSYSVILMQIAISTIGIYCFHQSLALLLNKRIALIGAIIVAFGPLYWITNVTIMMESLYINLFLISLYLLVKYVKEKNGSKTLILSSLFFGLSYLTHPLTLLWLPFLLLIVFYYKRKKAVVSLLAFAVFILIFAGLNIIFIAQSSHTSLFTGTQKYLFDKLFEHVQVGSSITSFLVITRNTIIPLLRNNTNIVVLISLISLILLFKRNMKIFFLGLLWIIPALVANQWWDSLFFGRHSAIAGFGLSFAAAIFLEKRKALTYVTFIYILLVSLPALYLLKQPIPYLEEQSLVETLPKGLLIDSHFTRPQIQERYPGGIFFVNEPTNSKNKLEELIDNYLVEKKPVFITSQALSEPYGLYSGPYLHILSLSYAKKYELEDILSLYKISKYTTIDKDSNMEIFKIVSKEKNSYPNILKLRNSRRRLDYFDPLTSLWFFAERAITNQSHSITNG